MTRRERFLFWIAWRLPKSIVYLCGIRLWAHATTGQYGNTVVPEITASEVMQRANDWI